MIGDDPDLALDAAERIGAIGVWIAQLSNETADESRRFVRALESLDLDALWFGEGVTSKESFSHAGILLAATQKLVIATGIANIYARDPQAMANGARTLGEAYPGRFLLGVGISHAPMVEERGSTYGPPMQTLHSYLQRMGETSFQGPAPSVAVPCVVGALGPKMTDLAVEQTDGVLSYLVPVEHLAATRQRVGLAPLLAVEVMAVAEQDPHKARQRARAVTSRYLARENYQNSLLRLGYGEAELASGGSDRLVDDIVAWGDAATIRQRVDEYLAAGADHVCVQVVDEPLDRIVEVMGQILDAG